MTAEFTGKYRGKVRNNVDPLMLGRLIVSVPAVAEIPLSWAMPCVPYAGNRVGLFTVPPIGANVWVEFERGDPNYPIWSGCFWGKGQVPVTPVVPTTKVLKTETIEIRLDDLQRSLSLEVDCGGQSYSIVVDPTGIELSCAAAKVQMKPESIELECGTGTASLKPSQVKLQCGSSEVELGPTVKVNGGALEVI